MLIETKCRLTRKDEEDKETTEYVAVLMNASRIETVLPTQIKGVLLLTMASGKQYLVKDTMKNFKK